MENMLPEFFSRDKQSDTGYGIPLSLDAFRFPGNNAEAGEVKPDDKSANF